MCADRSDLALSFLTRTPWSGASRTDLAGDASTRRYERLTLKDGKSAVLMDAPPAAGNDVRQFITIAKFLERAGLSPPAIISSDTVQGFLLLEDLGDAVFMRVIADDADQEMPLYRAAADVLLKLREMRAPDAVPTYSAKRMAQLTGPVFTWYAGRDVSFAAALMSDLEGLLAEHCEGVKVLALRDYHAENLIWLPDRSGPAQVGLLDFQDAVLCHPAYDLVSLLEDARRDLNQETAASVMSHYLSKSGDDPQSFGTAFALLGLQRNLRILGVCARLSLHYAKPRYIDLIPRVWTHLERDITHPEIAHLRGPLFDLLPTPDKSHLKSLKDRCGTIPTP